LCTAGAGGFVVSLQGIEGRGQGSWATVEGEWKGQDLCVPGDAV